MQRTEARKQEPEVCTIVHFSCLMHAWDDFSLWMNTSLHEIQITQLSTDGGGGVWEGEQKEGNGTEKTELTFQCLEFHEGKNYLQLSLQPCN